MRTDVLITGLFLLVSLSAGSIREKVGMKWLVAETPWDEALVGPSFDYASPDLVTVSVGQIAYLTCRVRQLGDRKVSWIRKKDLHILTVGSHSYTNDARFTVVSSTNGDTWNLRIGSVQLRDAGLYECQVSSEPKISRTVTLNVLASKASIVGSPEVYVRTGSHINLTCMVEEVPAGTVHFTWYRGQSPISGLKAAFQQQPSSTPTYNSIQQGLQSILLIKDAASKDSGNFSCAPTGVEPASILVHVLNGDRPAAMQHGHSRASSAAVLQVYKTLSFFCLIQMAQYYIAKLS